MFWLLLGISLFIFTFGIIFLLFLDWLLDVKV
jgi:hypothetical protein